MRSPLMTAGRAGQVAGRAAGVKTIRANALILANSLFSACPACIQPLWDYLTPTIKAIPMHPLFITYSSCQFCTVITLIDTAPTGKLFLIPPSLLISSAPAKH